MFNNDGSEVSVNSLAVRAGHMNNFQRDEREKNCAIFQVNKASFKPANISIV